MYTRYSQKSLSDILEINFIKVQINILHKYRNANNFPDKNYHKSEEIFADKICNKKF